MKTYTITDKISGTIVADNINQGDEQFHLYDTFDKVGLVINGYSKADVAEFLGTEDFELVVTRTQTEEI